MSDAPYARIYAFRRGKNIQPGCEVLNTSGLKYNDCSLANFLGRLISMKSAGYSLSVVEKPGELCPEIFPAGCELVLPMPNEMRASIDAVINAGADDEGTKKYPAEHDTRKF